jgi:hypothetical protein
MLRTNCVAEPTSLDGLISLIETRTNYGDRGIAQLSLMISKFLEKNIKLSSPPYRHLERSKMSLEEKLAKIRSPKLQNQHQVCLQSLDPSSDAF